MTTKIHVDISQGIIDVEGDPTFVREVYIDFKNEFLNIIKSTQFLAPSQFREVSETQTSEQTPSVSKQRARRKPNVRKKISNEDSGSSIQADSPKLDKNLNTKDLGAFYGQFEPKIMVTRF